MCSCIFYITVNHERKWHPGSWDAPIKVRTENFFKDIEFIEKFTLGYYVSTLALNGNDLLPTTGTEIIVTIVALIMGAFVNAYIFGNLVVLVQSINRKIQSFQEKLDITNTTMKNMNLTADL